MVVGLTTTYAISAYHHWSGEFESRSYNICIHLHTLPSNTLFSIVYFHIRLKCKGTEMSFHIILLIYKNIYSIFNYNELTAYLFRSPKRTIDSFRCLLLFDIKYLWSISYVFLSYDQWSPFNTLYFLS